MATSSIRPTQPYDRGIAIATKQDAMARALAEAEKRYRALVDHVNLAVFRAAPGGQLVEVNRAMVRMLGYDSDADLLAGEMRRSLFIDSIECDRVWTQLSRGGVDGAPTRWRRRDGTCVTVRLSLQIVRDESTGRVWCDGTAEDISDRMRQQELLRRTERMACLGATLAGVAHELNNPLAAILGFAQLLLKGDPKPDARRALETID